MPPANPTGNNSKDARFLSSGPNRKLKPVPPPPPPVEPEVDDQNFRPGITLTYGDMTFKEVNVRGYNRQAVLHGPDYLYTKHEIHLRGIYSGSLNGPNIVGGDTVHLKKQMIPRQNLTLSINDIPWIDVSPSGAQKPRPRFPEQKQPANKVGPEVDIPLPGPRPVAIAQAGKTNRPKVLPKLSATDLAHGPESLYSNAVELIGGRTCWIDMAFTFCVRDSDNESAPVVLSNRWTQTDISTNRFWQIRKINGEVIFNGAKIHSGAINDHWINTYYNALFIPVPNGYKRENMTVTLSQDGLAATYSFEDRQVPYIALPYYIADIEIQVGASSQQMTTDELVTAGFDMGLDVATGIPAMIGGKATKVAAIAGAVGKLAIAWVPGVDITVGSTVYGLPWAEMSYLHSWACTATWAKLVSLPELQNGDFEIRAVSSQGSCRERVAQYSITIKRKAVISGGKAVLKNPAKFLAEGIRPPIKQNHEKYMEAVFDVRTDSIPGLMVRASEAPRGKPFVLPWGGDSVQSLIYAALQPGVASTETPDERVLYL